MSMISSLIDELNKSADEWNGSNMFELARMCREAADTITELRGALQVASVDYRHLQDENAKLREEFDKMDEWHSKELLAAIDENKKLRELVRDMNKWLWNGADCTECPFAAKCDLNAAFESDLHAHICLGWSEIHDRMRELGVDA